MSQKKNRVQKSQNLKLNWQRNVSKVVLQSVMPSMMKRRSFRDERNALHDQRNKVMEEIMKYREEMKSNTDTKAKHQSC